MKDFRIHPPHGTGAPHVKPLEELVRAAIGQESKQAMQGGAAVSVGSASTTSRINLPELIAFSDRYVATLKANPQHPDLPILENTIREVIHHGMHKWGEKYGLQSSDIISEPYAQRLLTELQTRSRT